MSQQLETIPWELNSLYILLSGRDWPGTFYWALFLHDTDQGGSLYHAVSDADGGWRLEVENSQSVMDSKTLTAALKIGVIKPEFFKMFDQGLRELPIERGHSQRCADNFTCREWVMEAVAELEQMGLLDVQSLSGLENEARTAGLMSHFKKPDGETSHQQIYPVRSKLTNGCFT